MEFGYCPPPALPPLFIPVLVPLGLALPLPLPLPPTLTTPVFGWYPDKLVPSVTRRWVVGLVSVDPPVLVRTVVLALPGLFLSKTSVRPPAALEALSVVWYGMMADADIAI